MENTHIILLIIGLITVCFLLKQSKCLSRGKHGEHFVVQQLEKLKIYKKVLNDITLNRSEDMTCQIDHLLICTKGTFVIETKNYSGRVYGNEQQQYWTQVLYYHQTKYKMKIEKHRLYNPVKQNATHIYVLSQLLKKHKLQQYFPIFGYVIFCNTELYIECANVGSFRDFKEFVLSKNDVLQEQDVDKLYNIILAEKRKDISKRQHIDNIYDFQARIDNNICPRCNGKLILRNGKYGEFYGCENYPKCRFIKKIKI